MPQTRHRPVRMLLFCPACGFQHVDAPDGEWKNPPHRSHLCGWCGHVWRPADVATTGVAEIETFGLEGDSLPVIRGWACPGMEEPGQAAAAVMERVMRYADREEE